MSDVLHKIKTRRSIRTYKPDMVPQEILDQIIEAGTYAASGMGRQNTIIIQVTNKELRDKIVEMNCEIGGWEKGFDPFYGAPAMLIVLAKKDWANRVYDGSLVMGNMMLAAHELGIGSCWIHRAKQEFETEWGKELLKSLGIEEEYEGIGHCALGYLEGEYPEIAARKENRVFYIK
ncbi:MAG: nitroreductase family protein [Lachnospiraceae bacterium]|jgi:nitroreductase|nr:nitroreductase family protein [Lachnospiraceae bacterium]